MWEIFPDKEFSDTGSHHPLIGSIEMTNQTTQMGEAVQAVELRWAKWSFTSLLSLKEPNFNEI